MPHPIQVRREIADLVAALEQAANLLPRCGQAESPDGAGRHSSLTGAVLSAREAAREVAAYLGAPDQPLAEAAAPISRAVHGDPGE